MATAAAACVLGGLTAVTGSPAFAALPQGASSVEAERLTLLAGSGNRFLDTRASGGAGLVMWSNATVTATLGATSPVDRVAVVVRGDQCVGAPAMTVRVDGATVSTTSVPSRTWSTVSVPGSWAPGNHQVSVVFTNDATATGCDRNLRIDRIGLLAATAPSPAPTPTPTPSPAPTPAPVSGNPLAGRTLWVDPDSHARQEITKRPGDAYAIAQLSKLAAQSDAQWLGDWVPTSAVAQSVRDMTAPSAAAGQLPVIVLFAIPHRDCGSFSAGGLADAAAYDGWIRQVVAGLGDRRAVVVLEPDALAMATCLSAADQADRTGMIRRALSVLSTAPGAVTYLDAGNSSWIGVDDMARRLTDAGVSMARGFSLNVSNFNRTADETAYGDALSARLGGAHYVVDTSRNGNGPASGDLAWCNPAGRALGTPPTTATGRPAADAFLWVKSIGESDGECGRGEPRAGTWWPDYAIGLASRTAW